MPAPIGASIQRQSRRRRLGRKMRISKPEKALWPAQMESLAAVAQLAAAEFHPWNCAPWCKEEPPLARVLKRLVGSRKVA